MNSCCLNKSLAAFAALGLVACDPSSQAVSPPDTGTAATCQREHTAIGEIQGSQYRSPLEGQKISATGVVTHVVPGSGVYIESPSEAVHRYVSRALFLADENLSKRLSSGQQVAAFGLVSEQGDARDTLTSLVDIEQWGICAQSVELPLTQVKLPLRPRKREAFEGMRVSNQQTLTVTDVYRLDDGRIRLSHDGPLRVPTDLVEPGRSSARQFSRNIERSFDIELTTVPAEDVVIGASVNNLTGVLGHDGRYPMLHVGRLDFSAIEPPPAPAHPGQAFVRVVNANLENFFNGDGSGAGFPAERGPETLAEYQAKGSRIESAMARLQPDILAVQELENDGFGARSAAADLLNLLQSATGAEWRTVSAPAERIGEDQITVGIFYQPGRVSADGPAHVLVSAPFNGLSRQPLAQLFTDPGSGEKFWVSVNHLKSKGSCPDDGPDTSQKDGQGCWSQARTAAVESLLPWLQGLAVDSGTDRLLVMGDMNAYRKEDPARAFEAGGLIDLVLESMGRDSYTYVYRGELGTLDYAWASESMSRHVLKAQNWNINAAWPRHRDLKPDWLRYSDHDPVVVDLDFSQ